ncbi:oxygen-independent coproporphyrinogen III oxidase [Thalassotalea euphylliae]|uniref:Coproporphyrinogen-III oxidase n=1 Tax=Thalassotalea euphylliae TaxID=1655234 RepID=A0A3E0TV90_9GAMM|nr:oxygen-independent coproporphyrinogen III oxidase [Thalassotalea euphylliae]REL28596.1 oxygen-independent coproporphyrinogen III oxidase [Thalassotalea euphylliae]
MQVAQLFDKKLLAKYNTSGPRYTSYPTALEFHDEFNDQAFIDAVAGSDTRDLSIYVHIPFCHSLCYYCGCNKIVTRHRDKADIYLDYLAKEIIQRAPLFSDYQVKQIHWGGGTPSFLTKTQITHLVNLLKQHFTFAEQLEMSIEVDPREIELDLAAHLYALGFNRMSIGVQDIDEQVQKAINREQSTKFITEFTHHAKAVGFQSINIDLIYGLPHQTLDTFGRTLASVEEMAVDRISLFSYAHLPSRFAAQRKLKDEWLPNANEKLALMQLAIETLCQQGFDFIGMDHFAKPDDELAIAQRTGNLHRNFQGYTTQGDCDLLGLGVSSISAVGRCYSQNNKELKQYYQMIDAHHHAVEKGVTLNTDDVLRGQVIRSLMCNMSLDKRVIEQTFDIVFDDYFAEELVSLETFIEDNLVTNREHEIVVHAKARLLIRNICMSFDAYMKQHIHQQRFSRVI